MKTLTKLLMTALFAGMCSLGHSQTYEWQKPMQPTDVYKGTVSIKVFAGGISYYSNGDIDDDRWECSIEDLYNQLLASAKKDYGYDVFLRQFTSRCSETHPYGGRDRDRYYYATATVCTIAPPEPEQIIIPELKQEPPIDPLKQAINKALLNIKEGSRLALDQIRTINGADKEDFKDQVVEILLDEGFKVVAKEYLERLYEEQQNQQSGIYNDRTTVQENNFSAVGYYINVKRTDTAVKVQIINVSTGEYEANVTVNL